MFAAAVGLSPADVAAIAVERRLVGRHAGEPIVNARGLLARSCERDRRAAQDQRERNEEPPQRSVAAEKRERRRECILLIITIVPLSECHSSRSGAH